MTTNCLYNSGGTPLDYYAYTYNVGNQRTQVTRNTENHANYTYDKIGEVVSDDAFEWGGTARLNEQLGYVFDPAGNLAYRTNNALIANFKVNNLNELTTNTNGGTLTVVGTTTSPASSVSVNGNSASLYNDSTFAAPGLPLTTSYTAIAADTYGRHSTNTVTVNLSAGVGFQYDGNGNLTNDGLRNFVYDDENELIEVLVSNEWMSQFSYDGKMRRRIRKEFTWQGGAWVQTNEVHYVYEGNVVIQERDVNNLPTVTYTRGNDLSGSLDGAGGIGGLLARSSQVYSGAPLSGQSYYHADANGNVTMLIDSNQGTVAKYLYDAFGNTISKSGLLADANVYRFSSKEWHANSGLAYYLYRYYDPNLQRWLNRDPIGDIASPVNLPFEKNILSEDAASSRSFSPTLSNYQIPGGGATDPNLYTFVKNNPVNNVDPLGLEIFFGEIPPELIEEAIRLNGNRSRVNLPDGRAVDLFGKGHFDKASGDRVECPHTHFPKAANPAPFDMYPPGLEPVPKPSTLGDILDALKSLGKSINAWWNSAQPPDLSA